MGGPDEEDRTKVVSIVYGRRWRLESRLGAGGMGNVFRGFDLQENRPIAIKTLGMHLADDPEFVKRFEREAQLLERLRHKALPRIHELSRHEGMPYFVMTLVEGKTLAELLADKKKLIPRFVYALMHQLASVLSYLHERGVVHRDLKPENLMVDDAGVLSLIDFGISAQTNVTRLTLPGVALGTPLYMAPESITVGKATPASDVYAMGLLAFTMLTGEHPFSREDRNGMRTRQVNEVPPAASTISAGVSVGISKVISRALEKTPSARFATAGEFVEALRSAWGFEKLSREENTDEVTNDLARTAPDLGLVGPMPTRNDRAISEEVRPTDSHQRRTLLDDSDD
ncbi:MAG: serine/threonine-protein kinase [Archangium sp.]